MIQTKPEGIDVDSAEGSPGKESPRADHRNGEINIEKLRTFSRSLENLTSETLYSKWKRARGGGKPRHLSRSISLIDAQSIPLEQKEQLSKTTRKNSFHVLQENVFRPRCWTIGSPMEVIKEHRSPNTRDINDNAGALDTQKWMGKQRRRKIGHRYSVTLQFPVKQPSTSPPEKKQSVPVDEAGAKPVSLEQYDNEDGKQSSAQAIETTSEVVIRPSQTLRRVSEAAQEDEAPPIVARFLSEGDSFPKADYVTKKPINNLFLESVMIDIPPQSASMPASPNFLMRGDENRWDKDTFVKLESQNKLSRGLSNPAIIQDASKLGINNKRSKEERNNFSLGCIYAVVSQPSRDKDNSVNPKVKMSSGMITKEQRVALEEEFKNLQKVSLELDKDEMEDRGLKKSFSFSAGTKNAFVSQPSRRFSELNNHSAVRNYCSTRPTAKAILGNITNVGHKTEKERVQAIEEAFEWIRKELADLRAQDKDIMRTFTKVQAGIRKMKLQRTVSGSLDEDFESDVLGRSTDLSASFSYVPLVREFNNTYPRRASLI